MNEDNVRHIIKALSRNMRLDGRKNDEFRPVEIIKNVSATSEGSVHIKVGETEVIAGVKLQMEKPFPDRPDEGILMVNAEKLPISNENFEGGPPDAESIEFSRVIDRGIRESGMINLKDLCITSGEKVWGVMVDICPLNASGNLLDVGFLASIIALKNTTFPLLKENGEIDYKTKTDNQLPLIDTPIAVTVGKIGGYYVIDPVETEEAMLDARLTIIINENNDICALQKGGDKSLVLEDVKKMVELAQLRSKELRELIQ